MSQKSHVLTLGAISTVYSLRAPKNKNQKQLSDKRSLLMKVAAFKSVLDIQY